MRRHTGIVVGLVALVVVAGALVLLPGQAAPQPAAAAQIAAPAKSDDLSNLIGSANPELLKKLDASMAPPQVTMVSTKIAEATPEPAAAPAPGLDPASSIQPTPAPAASAHIRSAVNMRSGPSSSAATVGVLQAGEAVQVGANQGGWVLVTLDSGATGWVYSRYLDNLPARSDDASTATATPPVQAPQPKVVKHPAPQRVTVAGDDGTDLEDRTALIANAVTVYSDPGDSSSAFTLQGGQRVRIAEVRGNWMRVETANGTSAWIRR
jgi:SH3-like domain-containing protein